MKDIENIDEEIKKLEDTLEMYKVACYECMGTIKYLKNKKKEQEKDNKKKDK